MGLICFGQKITEKMPISKDLNKFEQVFGGVIDTEGATNLYPAVALAVEKIVTYKKDNHITDTRVKSRVICFTDGGDTSGKSAFDVVGPLIANEIFLDAVIIGGSDNDHENLRALANSSGGVSVRIPESREQLSEIFERESVVALSERSFANTVGHQALGKANMTQAEFSSFGKLANYPYVSVELKEIQKKAPESTSVSKAVTPDDLAKVRAAPAGGRAVVIRVAKEMSELLKEPHPNAEIFMDQDDVQRWTLLLKGTIGTPYEGGVWALQINFPNDYPFHPPKVVFLTPIYHCNISKEGRICLDILRDSWSPMITISTLIQGLVELLRTPNPEDAMEAWIASLARTDPAQYMLNAKDHTKQNASVPIDELKKIYNLANS